MNVVYNQVGSIRWVDNECCL